VALAFARVNEPAGVRTSTTIRVLHISVVSINQLSSEDSGVCSSFRKKGNIKEPLLFGDHVAEEHLVATPHVVTSSMNVHAVAFGR
jgi:hypothetical protein